MDAELQDILRDDYLGDVTALDLDELRARRTTCQAVETQLSYLRRLVQGYHDITTGELTRRREGGDPSDLSALVERLPQILSDRVHAPGTGHLPQHLQPGDVTGRLADQLAGLLTDTELDRPDQLSDQRLQEAGERLEALEQEVSSLRRALFNRIDSVQNELARRYRTGEATLDLPEPA